MNSDDDYINIPDVEYRTKYLIPVSIRRGVAKELIASKGNTKAIYALSLKHRVSLQTAGYVSRLDLKHIEQYRKRR